MRRIPRMRWALLGAVMLSALGLLLLWASGLVTRPGGHTPQAPGGGMAAPRPGPGAGPDTAAEAPPPSEALPSRAAAAGSPGTWTIVGRVVREPEKEPPQRLAEKPAPSAASKAEGSGEAGGPHSPRGAPPQAEEPQPIPVAGASVSLERAPKPGVAPDALASGKRFVASAVTGEDGRFELVGAPSGTRLRLCVEEASSAGAATELSLLEPRGAPADGPPRLDLGDIWLVPAEALTVVLVDVQGDGEGPPILGARVWAEEDHTVGVDSPWARLEPESCLVEAEPGADGTYVFRRLSRGEHRVWAHAAGYAIEDETAKVPRGEPLQMDLWRLRSELEIRGVVVTTDGRPIAGAVIRSTSHPAAIIGATSDSSGGFVLRNLREEQYTLEVRADGFATLETEVAGGRDGVELLLYREAVLSGRVVRDGSFSGGAAGSTSRDSSGSGAQIPAGSSGQVVGGSGAEAASGSGQGREARPGDGSISDSSATPIESARVQLRAEPTAAGASLFEATTDASGLFEIRGAPPCRYDLTVEHSDYSPETLSSLEVAEGQRIADLVFELAPGLSKTIRVLEAGSEEPVVWAEVGLSGGEREDKPSIYRTGRTGTEGRSTLDGLREGVYVLTARRGLGDCFGVSMPRVEVSAADPSEITVRLERGGGIEGRVVDAEGTPVEGAGVVLGATTDEGTPEDLRYQVHHLWNSQKTTDPSGRFAFEGLPTFGGYWIHAAHREHAPAEVGPIAATAGAVTAGVEVRLSGGGWIEGRVLDAGGSPVLGAAVSAEPSSGPAGPEPAPNYTGYGGRLQARVGATTDAEGAYQLIRLVPGRFDVKAWASTGWSPSREGVEVREGEGTTGIDLVVPVGSLLEGEVVTAAGEPVANATVTVQTIAGDSRASTSTDDDGRFTVEGLEPGTWLSTACRPGFSEGTLVVDVPGPRVRIVLDRGARIEGRLRARGRTWLPSSTLQVMTWRRGKGWDDLLTGRDDSRIDSTGRFDLDVPAGLSLLVFRADGFASAWREVWVAAGETRRLAVEIEPSGVIQGTVVTRDGEPVGEATVALEPPQASAGALGPDSALGGNAAIPGFRWLGESAGHAEFAHSDDDGSFTLEAPPGPTAIVASRSGYAPRRIAGLTVVAGESLSVTIVLEAGRGVQGMVTREGRYVAGAIVVARGPLRESPVPEARRDALTDFGGLYAIADLSPGDYEVLVYTGGSSTEGAAPPGPAARGRVRVEDDFAELNFDLAKIRVAGRVLVRGEPAAEAYLTAVERNLAVASDAWSDEEGRYSLELPSAGRYLIRIRPDEGSPVDLELTVPEGASDIERDLEIAKS